MDTISNFLCVEKMGWSDAYVYPFVVPFVPIQGTALEHHPKPDSAFMQILYPQIGTQLRQYGLNSQDTQAGCAKCGACSSLRAYE